MSCNLRNLSRACYTNGFTLWHYWSKASLHTITTDKKYFLPARDILKPGDFIYISTNGGYGGEEIYDGAIRIVSYISPDEFKLCITN